MTFCLTARCGAVRGLPAWLKPSKALFRNGSKSNGTVPTIAAKHTKRAAVRLLYREGRRLGLVSTDPTLDLLLPPRTVLRTRALTDEEDQLGRIWSFTDAQYQPPPPYIPRSEDFKPFAIAAVELADEQMVVLGQVADGYTVDDLQVGQQVELVVEELFSDADGEHVVWKWRPIGASA